MVGEKAPSVQQHIRWPLNLVLTTSMTTVLAIVIAGCQLAPPVERPGSSGDGLGEPSTAGVPPAQSSATQPHSTATESSSPTESSAPPTPLPVPSVTLPSRDVPPQDEADDGLLVAAFDGVVVEGGEIGAIYNLSDIRVGRHAGFTRIVWEMAEAEGSPYHRIVSRANEDAPPGEPFGRYWLEISMSDVYLWDRPELLQSRDVDAEGAVSALAQIMIGDDALYSVGIALDGPARFEVSALENPVRLVLDVFDVDGR